MIGSILLKELRDHLLSLRFQMGLLLAVALVSASAFVLAGNYQRERSEYYQRQRQEDDFLARYAHLNRLGAAVMVSRPPASTALVRGLPNDAGVETLDVNPMPELFPPMDLALVVAVIFSLLGIVLGFDAVNGEGERGTLKLMLAHRVRRFQVLVAKWAGGMLVLVLAFLAAVLAGAAIVLLQSGTHWNADEWLSFAWVCGISLLYCGAFFALALMLSTLARRSSVSVLASMFAWVLLVLLVPNLSPYVAAQIVRAPARAALERDRQFITSEERDEIIRSEARKIVQKYNLDVDWRQLFMDVTPEAVKRRLAADPGFRRLYEQIRNELMAMVNDVNRRQGEKAGRLMDAWRSRARQQFELSRRLSYASPLPPFVYAATELSVTGFRSRTQYLEQASRFSSALWGYAEGRFREEQRKNPALTSNNFLDLSTRPRFAYVPPRFSDRLEEALPFVRMLVAWNAVFFAGAMLGFLRFDVR
jgi:ABC-type transport system involved in multi-copper enzyme maturation permease subunit